MDPIEIRARRLALGLSQGDLARILGVNQEAVSRWEAGTRAPRDPVEIRMRIGALEDYADATAAAMVERAEDEYAGGASTIRTYARTTDLWAADPDARRHRAPAALHQAAAALASRILADTSGLQAHIVEH